MLIQNKSLELLSEYDSNLIEVGVLKKIIIRLNKISNTQHYIKTNHEEEL